MQLARPAEPGSDHRLIFGPFEVSPGQGSLLADGKPVRLGSRALSILLLLIERAGQIVSHQDIRSHVWQGIFVDDANLRVHIAALRKVLGEGQGGGRYILNVPGQGYRFVAPLSQSATSLTPPAAAAPEPAARLPILPTRLVGRDAEITAVTQLIGQHRLVTLAGPGGMGKTSLAIAAAWAMVDAEALDACFVDLSPVTDPALVASALASAIGLSVPSQTPVPSLVAMLRQRRLLIVLDNCEHVIEQTAILAEAVLRGAPQIRILATSREPLLAEGEWVRRVAALDLPAEPAELSQEDILGYPAVQLFVERATASRDSFQLTEAAARAIAAVCQQLDGIPLAIELAAAQVGTLSVPELAERLKDRFGLLARGRRTALPRQQTLKATLDWSYGILSEPERIVLHRLAIFAGAFPFDAAASVVPDNEDERQEIADLIARIVAKSLLSLDLRGDTIRYRLLFTTRSYAADRLRQTNEWAMLARRHASYVETLMQGAAADWKALPAEQWRDTYCRSIDDIRAALDWAFGPDGDITLGCRLTDASSPVWFQLALVDEYRERLQRALRTEQADKALLARLNLALGAALYNTGGPSAEMLAAYERAHELAAPLAELAIKLGALWGLGGLHCVSGDYAKAVGFCRRIGVLAEASGDPQARALHDRVMAWCLHLTGDHRAARDHADRAVRADAPVLRDADRNFQQYDQRVAARSHLIRILWVQGFPDRALRVAREAREMASGLHYPPPLCHLLVASACPLALWTGDLETAQSLVKQLIALSSNLSFDYWRSWVTVYETAIALHQGTLDREAALDALRHPVIGAFHRDLLGTLHPDLAEPSTLRRAESGLAGWCAPEILRSHGEAMPDQDAAAAEVLFRRSLALAEAGGALSWALRSATSLARLQHRQGDPASARATLHPVLARFTEGHGTADHRTALALLERIG